MNGPRTNQFVAPTSFITSISRRREKIESRIVFAIRSDGRREQDHDRDREDDLDPRARSGGSGSESCLSSTIVVHARRERMRGSCRASGCPRPSSA